MSTVSLLNHFLDNLRDVMFFFSFWFYPVPTFFQLLSLVLDQYLKLSTAEIKETSVTLEVPYNVLSYYFLWVKLPPKVGIWMTFFHDCARPPFLFRSLSLCLCPTGFRGSRCSSLSPPVYPMKTSRGNQSLTTLSVRRWVNAFPSVRLLLRAELSWKNKPPLSLHTPHWFSLPMHIITGRRIH